MAGAARSGHVVAGDDRGEVGLWDASGERVLSFRVNGAVCDADVAPDGSRVAVRSVTGELTVAEAKGGKAFTAALNGAGLVRLDPQGDVVYVVDANAGRVDALNAWGK